MIASSSCGCFERERKGPHRAALSHCDKRGESPACLYQGPRNWLQVLMQGLCQFRSDGESIEP
ncbi:hypothetical protein DN824_04105 [Stutzerimonas nosocomialis]|uniref:Uncharacterized protein n=1 Tax=Stutzerimonas nosocomialis TaxID=1056496 RepID=A0A5R9Q873_9GAMM|nr:hypothetical protein DN824_04105 [Stutzerimonas nosocomialis]TLX61407.1 hypothetical protein DN820_21565 [Stutzerimonas nosocomialis]